VSEFRTRSRLGREDGSLERLRRYILEPLFFALGERSQHEQRDLGNARRAECQRRAFWLDKKSGAENAAVVTEEHFDGFFGSPEVPLLAGTDGGKAFLIGEGNTADGPALVEKCPGAVLDFHVTGIQHHFIANFHGQQVVAPTREAVFPGLPGFAAAAVVGNPQPRLAVLGTEGGPARRSSLAGKKKNFALSLVGDS